jgi:hypothetical protein
MDTVYIILDAIGGACFLLILCILYRLRKLEKDTKEIKKLCKELLERMHVPLLEHKPKKDLRSIKASERMKEMWRKNRENQDA